ARTFAQDKPQQTSSSNTETPPATQTPSSTPQPTPPPTPKQSPTVRMGTELDGSSIITNTDLITLTVTVTDTYGRYVSGLSQKAFTLFDDKQQQEITFFSDDDSPVSVGVIFDVSGSMSGEIGRAS